MYWIRRLSQVKRSTALPWPFYSLILDFDSIAGNEAGMEDPESLGGSTVFPLPLSSVVLDFGSVDGDVGGEQRSLPSPASAWTVITMLQ